MQFDTLLSYLHTLTLTHSLTLTYTLTQAHSNSLTHLHIQISDASTGAEIVTLKGHKSSALCSAWSPGGDMVASGSFDKVRRGETKGQGKRGESKRGEGKRGNMVDQEVLIR